MSFIYSLIILTLTFYLGWLIVSLLKVRHQIEKCGLSILLGSLFFTIGMMVFYQYFQNFSLITTILNLCLQIVLLLIISQFQKVKMFPFEFSRIFNSLKNLSTQEKLLLYAIGIIIFITGFSNLVWPVSDWDSIALYDFRAKVIQISGNWNAGKDLGYFFHYPPFTSLLHASFYLAGFERVKVWYSFIFVGFLMTFYALIRRNMSRSVALAGVLLVSIAPILSPHIKVAYTNLPYSVYFSLAIIYAWFWLKDNNYKNMILAFLLAAGSTWIRSVEPFWLIILGIFFFGKIILKSHINWKVFTLSFLSFWLIKNYWGEYLISLNITERRPFESHFVSYIPFTAANIVSNFFAAFNFFIAYILYPMGFLLILTMIILIFDYKTVRRPFFLRGIITIMALLLMAFAGIYYFSFVYETWDLIGGSATRLIMFIEPLIIFLIAHNTLWEPLLGKKK